MRRASSVRPACDRFGMLTKRQRLDEVYRRLAAAAPARNAAGALALLAQTINAVEDELSGLPYDQLASRTMVAGPRMYPPLPDSRRPGIVGGVDEYAAAKHRILIGANGAMSVRHDLGAVELSKPGADGKGIEE